MTISNTFAACGFSALRDGSLYWGEGSIVWGHTANVKRVGANLYRVTVAHWAYDCAGECVRDTSETRTLYGAQALAWVFTEMPRDFWEYAARHVTVPHDNWQYVRGV